MGEVLRAFNPQEVTDASLLLSVLAAEVKDRKLEEDDWTKIYCKVKQLSHGGWSNLMFRDIQHEGLGVEFKLLKREDPSGDIGKWLMHPAATRRIKYDPSKSAEECKKTILDQFGSDIAEFEARVQAKALAGMKADLRWGILLWKSDGTEFLYFEERLERPNPNEFRAEWNEGSHRGKATRNLWIYDRATGEKRYSITLPENGAKIQPYFYIPSEQEGAHVFKFIHTPRVKVMISEDVYNQLCELCGTDKLDDETLRKLLGPKKK